MTGPGRRAVSYLPGRWAALVTDELCLLADLQLADPVLAACWEAAGADGADAVERVLQTLMPPGRPAPPGFVLVGRSRVGLRLVVAGRAHAEVFAGQQQPVVRRAPNPHSRVDEPLDPGLDVRLVADDATPIEPIPPLPFTSGIVPASFVLSTMPSAPAAATVEPQDEAAGWIPPPLAQPSGVFRALPWRSSFAGPDTPADDPSQVAEPASGDGAPDAPEHQQPAEAIDPGPAQWSPQASLVQAVYCTNGHPNPLHIHACRACGAGFAPQQPVTIERPSLGVLRVPTGEVVQLDGDVLLGRAPFAVDRSSVRVVEVASPDNDISRSHVRITLEGWQVLATDLGSTNGTAVTLPGRPATLLRPHDPVALVPGTVLSLADEADIRFDLQ